MVTKTVVGEQKRAVKKEEDRKRLDAEIAALLGEEPADPETTLAGQKLDLSDVFAGVSVTWLAHAFQMDRVTCKKKLAQCPPLRKERGAPVYSLRQAAGYLVAPKVDIAEYIKTVNPKDLPPLLQDSYWSAMIKRQTWEERAGKLWPSSKVLEILANLARDLKTSITLWADNIESITGLTPEQMVLLSEESDAVLRIIHEVLVTAPERSLTPSSISEQQEDADGGREEES
jgi:hypothetical protein